MQGLRRPKNRSLLEVNEDFKDKRNAEKTCASELNIKFALMFNNERSQVWVLPNALFSHFLYLFVGMTCIVCTQRR